MVVLQWNDPWGASANDYDLLLTDSTGATVYAVSQQAQDGDDKPYELSWVTNNGTKAAYVYVVVRKYSGFDRHLKITSWGGGWFDEHYTPAGSIWGHPSGSNVICAGGRPLEHARYYRNIQLARASSDRLSFPGLSQQAGCVWGRWRIGHR